MSDTLQNNELDDCSTYRAKNVRGFLHFTHERRSIARQIVSSAHTTVEVPHHTHSESHTIPRLRQGSTLHSPEQVIHNANVG